MTIKQALELGNKKVRAKNSKTNTPALDTEILLGYALKKSKEFLYTHPERKITTKQKKKYIKLINRRCFGEPVAYLTNHKEFFGLDFFIDKRVLIPRPETELLVEEVLSEIREQKSENRNLVMADVGTGSGCIAISLAKNLPQAEIIATDISKKAIKVATQNARKHQVKMKILNGDLLTPLAGKKIDVLVANLPYGWRQWKNITNQEAVGLKFEPASAIFTGEKGLAIYVRLFKQLAERNQKPKIIIVEFDPRQTSLIKKLIKQYLPEYQLTIKKDLAGLNRVLIVKFEK